MVAIPAIRTAVQGLVAWRDSAFNVTKMNDTDPQVFQQVLSQFGGPAFVRRGREVQLAFDAQVGACNRKREEWLEFVRLPLGTLFALAGTEAALEEFLDNPMQLQTLKMLMRDLRPQAAAAASSYH